MFFCFPELIQMFYKYLILEHAEENLEFWTACEVYKKTRNEQKRMGLADQIVNKYISELSIKQVNLPAAVRNNVLHAFLEANFSWWVGPSFFEGKLISGKISIKV